MRMVCYSRNVSPDCAKQGARGRPPSIRRRCSRCREHHALRLLSSFIVGASWQRNVWISKRPVRSRRGNRTTSKSNRRPANLLRRKPSSRSRITVTPDEGDPLWGADGVTTRISDGPTDSASNSSDIESPSNYTEMTPAQVLGKDITALGDFKLLKKLGEGAMGAVYKAEQVSFHQRIVALKVLFPHVANIPKLVARLEREAKVMFALDHPNIVASFANTTIRTGSITSPWSTSTWQSFAEMADAARPAPRRPGCGAHQHRKLRRRLAYAHSLNMVHRDIKPDNILLSKKGAVKVADLGMVKVDDEEMSLTQTGHAVGTPWFMPLEQARNAKEIDGRSDIYALGCTLYAPVDGPAAVFGGGPSSRSSRPRRSARLRRPGQANSDVPERLDLIIAKMTAKQPKNRYQTCDEVIKDLESLNLASQTLAFLTQKARRQAATQGQRRSRWRRPASPARRSRGPERGRFRRLRRRASRCSIRPSGTCN